MTIENPAPLKIAQQLLADRHAAEALELVDAVLSHKPDQRSALMSRARITERLGDFESARTAYTKAAALGARADRVDPALKRMDEFEKSYADAEKLIEQQQYGNAITLLQNLPPRHCSLTDLFLARAYLAAGQFGDAAKFIAEFRTIQPGHTLGQQIEAEIAAKGADAGLPINQTAAERAQLEARELVAKTIGTDSELVFHTELPQRLAAIEEGHEKGAQIHEQIQWMRDHADALQQVRWGDDPDFAKAAHFAFSDDDEIALRNYDPYLIEKSVEFGYINWPRRIQEQIIGKSVLDIGCGFGAFGNGFLIAGARSYTGIDPQMPLDSTTAKNKRTRAKADLGITPREIMDRCPEIQLINGVIEDLETDTSFDTVVLHNVTEHLQNIRQIIPAISTMLNPGGLLVYHHHNFFCWNGHHFAPVNPAQYVPGLEKHELVVDWNHILAAPTLPDDHYFNTNLNQIRLDEIKQVTAAEFEILTWQEIESPPEVAERLTDDIYRKVTNFDASLTQRDLMVNAVLCVARPIAVP